MITVQNITKKFDDYTAVDHIDLEMREGMVFGLIGTNSAGKSTLLRMVSGVMKPDEGEAAKMRCPLRFLCIQTDFRRKWKPS